MYDTLVGDKMSRVMFAFLNTDFIVLESKILVWSQIIF